MKLPYQCVLVRGDVIFAAQGSRIHTFSVEPVTHISTWVYPLTRRKEGNEAIADSKSGASADEDDRPPAKRRKVEKEIAADDAASPCEPVNKADKRSKKKMKKVVYSSRELRTSGVWERPWVQGLYGTPDGRHIVALTGADKTIWVFSHDGKGHFEVLSQRIMPKRPCSLDFTPDLQTLVCADKFGDVYALPLIPKTKDARSSPPASKPTAPTARTPPPFYSQASELTVHTLRNLRALENQKSVAAQTQKYRRQNVPTQPTFEHTLLLGHVSMLTAVASATDDAGRPYILTGDRDEHVRVSRGLPQAHVIEGFCLGHCAFVSRLCVLPGGLLVSGGGDEHVFLWEWKWGRLAGKEALLGEVRKVAEGVEKVAVTGIWRGEWQGELWVFVACERIPFIFPYRLTTFPPKLEPLSPVPVLGYPLDASWAPSTSSLLVTVHDTTESSPRPSMLKLQLLPSSLSPTWAASGLDVPNVDGGADAEMAAGDLEKMLYTTENLRKTGTRTAAGED